MKVVFLIFSVNDLSGGGGAERRYAMLSKELSKDPSYDVHIVLDQASLMNYQSAGYFNQVANEKIHVYSLNRSRFYKFINGFKLWLILKKLDPHLIQVCKLSPYENYYLDYFFKLGKPKKVLSIEHCRYAYDLERYNNKESINIEYLTNVFKFRWDGLYTHYQKFVTELMRSNFYPNSIKTFVSPSAFPTKEVIERKGSKEKIIAYASRLDEQKNPFQFVDAIIDISKRNLLSDWSVVILGKGPLESAIKDKIKESNLELKVKLDSSYDISKFLQNSSVFISTQLYENFPSFSLTDAMAFGNVVIAGNYGDTRKLIGDGKNGFLFDEKISLAECIEKAILLSDEKMLAVQNENMAFIKNKNNIGSYMIELKKFYSSLMQ